MKTAWLIALIVFGLLAFPLQAAAQSKDPAVEHFERGVALLDDAQYAGAAAELERSLALRETAPVLYNLGLAYRGVGRYRDAIKQFERFLVIRDEKKHKKMAELVETLLKELKAALVHVDLRVSGGATSIRLDDQPFAQHDGSFPIELDPGEHAFEAERSGYSPVRRSLSLKPGEQTTVALDASSQPKPAKVTIEVTPSEAEIWLDGKLVGRGRYRGVVDRGSHTLRVEASGYESAQRSLRANPGAQEQLSIALNKSSQPLTQKWWFWAGSAAVVGATVLAIVVAQPQQPSPHEGTLGFVTEALR